MATGWKFWHSAFLSRRSPLSALGSLLVPGGNGHEEARKGTKAYLVIGFRKPAARELALRVRTWYTLCHGRFY